jgi:nucleoside-diphosphate-sugar epimerase
MAETVLVTGGTGFVGGWCIVELVRRGYAVRATVRSLRKEASVRAAIAAQVDAGDRLTLFAADLTADAGWDAALAGCDYVLHVASPLGGKTKDPNDLIVAARDGTLRVLAAALKAKVRRVVLTSSGAACCPPLNSPDSLTDETYWTDAKDPGLTAYRKSKTVAERAAWDFMMAQGAGGTLATVLPAGVFGPVLTPEGIGSVGLVQRLLTGAMPGIPRLGFNVIDVRDLADLHIRAMTAPEAAGQRFIAAGDFLWMADIAKILRDKLGERAAKVPTRQLPNFLLRLGALFDPGLRDVTPMLGHRHAYSSVKAQRVFGWMPRPAVETIVDCANSLIAKGAVRP